MKITLRNYAIVSALVLLVGLCSSVVAQDGPESFMAEGVVVCCLDCWLEKDRTKFEFGTSEDLLKAKGCVEGGDPTLLAIREGEGFKYYILKEGAFKLPGKNWLEFVGKIVSVSGKRHKNGEFEHLVVDTLNVTGLSPSEREAKAAVGTIVGLKLPDLSGSVQDLALFKGRVVVLNFWATFCEPCREEMPDLAEIQSEFAPFGVQVIGANADAPEDRPKVLKFIREAGVNFPVWMGSGTEDMVRFGLGEALPGTVLIDKQGRVAKVISGIVDPASLRSDIEKLLELPAAVPEGQSRDSERKPMRSETARTVSSVPS